MRLSRVWTVEVARKRNSNSASLEVCRRQITSLEVGLLAATARQQKGGQTESDASSRGRRCQHHSRNSRTPSSPRESGYSELQHDLAHWTPIILGRIWFDSQGPQHARRALTVAFATTAN